MNDQSQPAHVPEPGAAPIPSNLDFPVVGIGASAGGLQALLRFFEQMPAQSGMAFVVILHLSPRHESNMAGILQNATRLRVRQINAPTAIEKNHVYVISPRKDLTMVDGYLRVTEARRPRGRHVAIDLFFRTLADAHQHRAFAIVLSGTGSDGAVGLARVKELGGVTMAQLPDDAEYDGMPRSAIATNAVDVVLPVADMPQKLLALWDNASRIEMPPPGDEGMPAHPPLTAERGRAAEEALHDVIGILRNRTGHDFRHYKRATVLRRIERRMQVNAVPHLVAYREHLHKSPDETPALLRDMLIGVTNFFRDRESFEALERDIVPLLFEQKAHGEQVRAWAAGCSTGEEAYSLAMLLCEHADTLAQPPGLQVFATDIDDSAIAVGRTGSYPEAIIADVIPARLRQFFNKEGPYYRVKKPLRDHVLFAAHNVLRDPPFSRLDLVSCRNLLIYLDREVQAEVLEMFHFALRPGGYLFLGSSESADSAAKFFEPVDKKNRIFRAKTVSRSSRYAATLPIGTKHRPLSGSPAVLRAPERRRSSLAELHQRVLEQYAPPSVIVDYDSNIIHMSDRAGRFLRYVGGEPSHNLLALVYPELRLELRTALYQATQSGKSVEARRTRIEREGRTFYVNMTARPFRDPEGGAEIVLVLFDEVEDTLSPQARAAAGEDTMLVQLEAELQRTKDQLQTTIEHAETSTEELKASNEELQAINEELRSATEELETSKEELQSINEELITVNHELKMKVEETGKINDDLQNLIASTDIATIFVDRALRIERYTPRAVDIFSIIPSDVGRSLLDITHRLDYERLATDVAETFASLRMIEREVTSNDNRWYIARLLPYRTTEDRIEGAVLTFIDITGRRQAEERLREGEERVSFVLESTKDYAIITMDPDGLVTTWNKGAERMFGYTEEEMLGQPGSIIFTPEDLAAGMHLEEMRRAREDGRAEDERWHTHRNGTRLFCSGVMTPLSHGAVRGYAKIARDVTGGKRAEHEREAQLQVQREMSAKAQAANQLKDEFLAIMSHELKHPLNLIHVNAEILSRLPAVQATGAAVRATETIQRAVMGQAKIIDDLLDFSRVHTGKLALRRTAMDLVRVIDVIAETLRRDGDGEGSGVAVRTEGTNQPLWIHADTVRVEQIIWNLASNALKFTPRGGTVMLSLRTEDGMARLDVVDNGMGIARDSLPNIFDMFAQSTAAKLAGKAGLGIGLALVKELTELHGGRVQASSDGPGRGARFTVWLPLDVPVNMADGGTAPRPVLDGVRVLLVDDTEDTLEAFGELLGLEGAVVTAASSGQRALELARSEDFDVVLSDIGMPDMDGCQLLEALRRDPHTATLPAVALTGYGRPNDVKRVMEAGFNAHISKPVTLGVLLDTLNGIGIGGAAGASGE